MLVKVIWSFLQGGDGPIGTSGPRGPPGDRVSVQYIQPVSLSNAAAVLVYRHQLCL